jgi:hypothetical protein
MGVFLAAAEIPLHKAISPSVRVPMLLVAAVPSIQPANHLNIPATPNTVPPTTRIVT